MTQTPTISSMPMPKPGFGMKPWPACGELYCDRPNDPEVAQDWQDLISLWNCPVAPELLESLRADDIAAAPLLFCAE